MCASKYSWCADLVVARFRNRMSPYFHFLEIILFKLLLHAVLCEFVVIADYSVAAPFIVAGVELIIV